MVRKTINNKGPSEARRSWEMSHLPALQSGEIKTLLRVLSAWFNQDKLEVTGQCNIPLLWEYAERHGIGGLIGSLAVLGKVDMSAIGDLGRQRYLSNILRYEQCLHICRLLQEHAVSLNIPVSFIKGAALNLQAYKDPGDRSFSDIDILVGSRVDAWQLIHALDGECHGEGIEESMYNRFRHPGRIHAKVLGWELEFCYPVTQRCEPMFELLARHKDSIMKIPADKNLLTVPPPDVHMILLIQHLAKHLCCRLIWFLDIAVLARENNGHIDFDHIERELKELQLLNVASEISLFCNHYIDNNFPVIGPDKKGWNSQFQKLMVSPQLINGHLSMHHKSGRRHNFYYMLSPALFHLIADPQWQTLHGNSSADRWLTSRILYTFRINNGAIGWLLGILLHILIWPIARLAIILAWRLKVENTDIE